MSWTVRADEGVAVPWRNGYGSTRELCRVPDRDDWLWRLSVATSTTTTETTTTTAAASSRPTRGRHQRARGVLRSRGCGSAAQLSSVVGQAWPYAGSGTECELEIASIKNQVMQSKIKSKIQEIKALPIDVNNEFDFKRKLRELKDLSKQVGIGVVTNVISSYLGY